MLRHQPVQPLSKRYVPVAKLGLATVACVMFFMLQHSGFRRVDCELSARIHASPGQLLQKAHATQLETGIVDLGRSATPPDNDRVLMVWPKNDQYIARFLNNGNVIDPPLLKDMLQFVKPGGHVVEVGGNFGTYAVYFSREVGEMGRVTSFEPQQMMFDLLQLNLAVNDMFDSPNYVCIHGAAGHESGKSTMKGTIDSGANQGELFEDTHKDPSKLVNYGGRSLGKGGEIVNLFAIDKMELTNVTLLKVDAEGAEPMVFWGGRETIRRDLPVIFFENGQKLGDQSFADLNIPAEVRNFNIQTWAVDELGYTFSTVGAFGTDFRLLPPGVTVIADSLNT